MKTFQTEEELSSKIIFSNAEYKALLNISITPNQIWFNISKGDKHYRMSAAKTVKFTQTYIHYPHTVLMLCLFYRAVIGTLDFAVHYPQKMLLKGLLSLLALYCKELFT